MVTRQDYESDAVHAARAVVIELTHLLGEYRENIVLIGGWVPELLCPQAEEAYVGSLDVDLALDHRGLTEAGYRTIEQLLKTRGYVQGGQPFIFHRKVTVGGREVTVEVDLLGSEYGGTGPAHRTQPVQDVRVRKARGADLAFKDPEEVVVSGALPNGAAELRHSARRLNRPVPGHEGNGARSTLEDQGRLGRCVLPEELSRRDRRHYCGVQVTPRSRPGAGRSEAARQAFLVRGRCRSRSRGRVQRRHRSRGA